MLLSKLRFHPYLQNGSHKYINTSWKYHWITGTQSRVITKVHDPRIPCGSRVMSVITNWPRPAGLMLDKASSPFGITVSWQCNTCKYGKFDQNIPWGSRVMSIWPRPAGLMLGKVSKGAKIRNRYNQVPHLTQDTNGKPHHRLAHQCLNNVQMYSTCTSVHSLNRLYHATQEL